MQITVRPPTITCGASGDPDWYPSSGAGGGCFIATSIYGSKSHPHVQTLRKFRDEVLLRTEWGRSLVDFYYRHSPDVACFIGEHDALRSVARAVLTPLVLVITYPWYTAIILAVWVALLIFTLKLIRNESGAV